MSSEELMVDILDAAAVLFSRRGFGGTSTQELADAVGLVKATLYYHIGSKEELLFRIANTVLEERNAQWREVLADEEAPAITLLPRIIEVHCEMLPKYRDWFIVVADELKYLPRQRRKVVLKQRTIGDTLVQGLIERGHDAGELRVPDPEAAALVLMAMLNSMTRWYHPRGRLKADQIVNQVSSLVLHGVAS